MNDLLNHDTGVNKKGHVECLGITFPSEDARREHFLGLLAEKLKDPAFRKQEGFPQGSDEAILAMSDPPYYTACPNPWLAEFVKYYGKAYDPSQEYAREPMAIDVSVSKTDPIYKAHSYHTKVPHLAIVPSILHFTEPGDIVLDGFAGSGMTGVAAQWCGTAPASYRHQVEMEWKKAGMSAPKWGARRAVLNDLSPAATFIGANYNLPFDVDAFAKAGNQLLAEVEREIGWMYETLHTDGKTKGRIEFTVWSEVFTCPECTGEVNFLEEALEEDSKRTRDVFPCPHCGSELNKDRLERVLETRIDPASGKPWKRVKFRPALIVYSIGKGRYKKQPDSADLAMISRIENMPLPVGIPTDRFPIEEMYHGSRIAPKGFTNIHHFFLPRSSQAMALLWSKAAAQSDPRIRSVLKFFVEQAFWTASLLNRFRPTGFSQVNQYLTGVYYVASQHAECSPRYILEGKLGRLVKTFQQFKSRLGNSVITAGTAASLPLPPDSIDYIFTDPPFGENIYYADLNFLIESWHGVTTDAKPEAIIDGFKNKALVDYQHLMQRCFAEYHRVLKPGRWMTVVFSNSKASVWNTIQVALQQAGFVVAEVNALDKVQGSYRQVTSTTAVKQDLVISAYKPNGGLEKRLAERGAAPESAWDFVQTHLRQLPVSKTKNGGLEMVVERDPRRIYDRMVAWFVRHDFPVPLSTEEFLEGMRSRFPERDGMVFLPEQVAEYDRKRAQAAQAPQMELFVSDERSAIDWLMDFLRKRPSTYQEVHPEFTTQVGAGWRKHEERPELSALLADNFLRYDGNGDVPSQIHSYLSTNFKDLRGLEKDDPRLKAKAKDRCYVPDPSKAKDLEQKRERSLLKEFESYKSAPGRRLKEFRLEVLRAGFKTAWAAKDYKTIIGIAQKIPEEALQEDEKLLLWYDQALTRMEADA
ncbi:DNA methylase [Azospirillum argentinense]|uniref:site-specific DNA-methyltransferase (adenine-specific) n=1 Tax=Azospirillum argentinense TaxID=2970906 RepID=A0A060DP48_9PROT|nr:DNA methyltransferase [Azospirillum argentinense]AIB12888.1 DNA methylase [Azospirillum argentinense]EZQ09641.1 DNA methylase [Azospirillum argentinense]